MAIDLREGGAGVVPRPRPSRRVPGARRATRPFGPSGAMHQARNPGATRRVPRSWWRPAHSSAMCFFVSAATTPESAMSEIRFGTAIRPFMMSENVHTVSICAIDPTKTAITQAIR